MKKIIVIGILLVHCAIATVYAQIQSNEALFNLNPTYYNPAFTGMQESGWNAVVLSRADWVSYKNVSNTSNPWNAGLALDKRFDTKKIGVGVNVTNTKLGRMNAFDLVGNVAYHLHLNERHKLSFGAKVGFNYVNLGDLNLKDQTDVYFTNAIAGNYFIPKIGVGLLYKSENFYAGIASPDVLAQDSKNILASNGLFSKFNINLNAGYKLNVNHDFYVQPSFLTVINPANITKTDINMVFGKNESFWGGIGFSPSNSYSAMGGIFINGRFKLSYAFTLYNTLVANPTSHELCLNWDLEDVL
jgi:type IX secretion system PorP/SprF family membrane protein